MIKRMGFLSGLALSFAFVGIAQSQCYTWKPLWRESGQTGPNGYGSSMIQLVNVLETWNSGATLVIGGAFTEINGESLRGLAVSDGTSWFTFGSGLQDYGTDQSPIVYAVLPESGSIVIAGRFGSAGSVSNTEDIAAWNGTSWTAVGPSAPFVGIPTTKLVRFGGVLYVGLANAGSLDSSLWRLRNNTWEPVGDLEVPIQGLAVLGDYLYIASGEMTEGTSPVPLPSHTYEWQNVVAFDGRVNTLDSAGWLNLNGGIGATELVGGPYKQLNDAITFDGKVIVTGNIRDSNLDSPVTDTWGITGWNPASSGTWFELDRGIADDNGTMTLADDGWRAGWDLALDGETILVAGLYMVTSGQVYPTIAGTSPIARSRDGLARWDGSAWSPVTCCGPAASKVVAFNGGYVIAANEGNWAASSPLGGIAWFAQPDVDFNNDGSFFDPDDIDDFLSVFSEGPCSTEWCDGIDINGDCSFFDAADIDAFLAIFAEETCEPGECETD